MKRYAKGELPTEIFRNLGFDTQVLGKGRITSCASRFKQYNERNGRTKTKGMTAEEKLSRA